MTEADRRVQSPFVGQESNAIKASGSSPCRGAAQFNKPDAVNPAGALWFQGGRYWRGVTDLER